MIDSNSKPFVSVLIPTCNRADSALKCLRSAINLDFADCEILFSDNSSNGKDKQQIDSYIGEFANDPRFRFVRPPSFFNMADHWEWATKQVSGHYFAILTDRHTVRPSMLKVLAGHLKSVKPDLLVWNVRSGFSELSGIERTNRFSGVVKLEDPQKVLRDYLEFSAWKDDSLFMQKLPRGLNSLYNNDLASKIREKHGRLYFPLSPDYTSAFLLLANARSMSHVDLPMYTSFGNQSNGQRSSTEGMARYAST